MTSQPNNPEKGVDELIGKWLDSESGNSDHDESSEDVNSSLTKEQIRRSAELQLVHSLLLQLADRDEVAKERRVQKVMQEIESNDDISGKFNRIIEPLVRYGVAAVIIISVAILFTQLSSNTGLIPAQAFKSVLLNFNIC